MLINNTCKKKLIGSVAFLLKMDLLSGSNQSTLDALNTALHQDHIIQIFQNKYLNNIVEQAHRFIKKRLKPILGLKSFHAALAFTIKGIAHIRIIQKKQLIGAKKHLSTFEHFAKLMAASYLKCKTRACAKQHQR